MSPIKSMTGTGFTTTLCMAALLPFVVHANVLDDPGFEDASPGVIADNGGLDQWGAFGGGFSVQSGIVHDGSKAVQAGLNTTGYSILYQNAVLGDPSMVENTTWNYSFWVYHPSGGSVGDSLNYAFLVSDSLNQDVVESGGSGTVLGGSLTSDTWTLVSGSFTAGSYGSTKDRLKATFNQNPGTTFYIDDLSLSITNSSGGSTNTNNTATVTVDPSVAMTNYTSLGEWNTPGDFDGWSVVQITNAAVAGGLLTGGASGTDSQLTRLTIVGGPDLDLGFNEYVDLRFQLPADYLGDVQVYHGNTFYSGIGLGRGITIPSSVIPKDGAFHTYRLNMGLDVYWRGDLTDLRIDLLDATGVGKSFAIDYVRVGDLAGDVYQPRYTSSNPAPGQLHELNRPVIDMESKHFRFQWDTDVATQAGWTADTPRGTLRNLEECWQVYVNALGYREPAESWTVGNRNGTRYKVNMSTWHSGYWAGGDSGDFGRLNITPDGLRVDPPTWVIPHELMHVFQMHQRDNGPTVDGSWWEGHANYGRELWISHYSNLYPNASGIDANYIHSAHMNVAHGRDYYLSWPFFVYLDENPDDLPDLGAGIVADMWENNLPGVYPYTTIEQLTPVTSLKDIIGYFGRRELTFDYQNQTAINDALNTQNPTVWERFQLSELVRRADDTNWWRVPMEMAPMQGAYATHELIPHGSGAGRVVTVNFRGLPDSSLGADWRAAFIVISDSGDERYTPLWNAGTNAVTLAANENRVYLTVAGTPDTMLFTGFDDLDYPYGSHGSKQRLHYEVQVVGATPRESDNGGTGGLVQHANGGGWKSTSAIVDATAYIGPNARVLNSAQVRNAARVEDYAVVRGNARVRNNAVVSGHALVWENAQVLENAKVRDWAIVSGSAVVTGDARALEHTQIQGGTVSGHSTAKGCAILWSGGDLSGHGVIDGDFMASRTVTNGYAFGHLPFSGVPDNWVRPAPDRLYTDYEFVAPAQSMIRDEIGVTDGYAIGEPTWLLFDTGRRGVLALDGLDQYVVLDKSLSDMSEISVTAWIKWNGGASNQSVWHFGAATNQGMFFTPDDGAGHAKFVIRNGGADQTLLAPAALSVGVWTHVAVTLSNGTTGRLYINGVLQQEGAITIAPDELNPPNTQTATAHHYLARGADSTVPFFSGSIDSFHVYTKALSMAEVAALGPANRSPVFAGVDDQSIGAGVTLAITNSASDPDLPWQILSYSLLDAPTGASIGESDGVVTWRPVVAQANTTNLFTVKVADNGSPSLSDTQSFDVTVSVLMAPVLEGGFYTNDVFGLQVTGDAGPDYTIEASTNLLDWSVVYSTNSPMLPFLWLDVDAEQARMQFYRVALEP